MPLGAQRRRKVAPAEVSRESGDVLESVAGQFFTDLAGDVEKEVDVARAEPVVTAALENDRPPWSRPQLVRLIDHAPLTRVAHPASFLCHD